MTPPKDWDAYGSTNRVRSAPVGNTSVPVKYVDLRPIVAPVMPVSLPAALHFYLNDGGGIETVAFTCRTHMCVGYPGVESLLSQPGIHYLLYVQDVSAGSLQPIWMARFGTIRPGTVAFEKPFVRPMSVNDILAGKLGTSPEVRDELLVTFDDRRYPHSCPRCGGAAFVGFNLVDCRRGCH